MMERLCRMSNSESNYEEIEATNGVGIKLIHPQKLVRW
jgi:hypothetical protein